MIDKVLQNHGIYGASKVKRHYTQLGLSKPTTKYLFVGSIPQPIIKVGDDKLLAGKKLIQYNKYDSDYSLVKWEITNSDTVITGLVLGNYGYLICRTSSYNVDLLKINMDTGQEVKRLNIGWTHSNSTSDFGSQNTRIANDKYGDLYITKGRNGGTIKLNQELEVLLEIARAQPGFQDDYLTVYDEYVVRVYHYSIETVICNLEGEELSRKNLGANYGYSNVLFDESLDSFYMINSRYMTKLSFNDGIIGDRIWMCSQKECTTPILLDDFKNTMLARDTVSTYNTFFEADKTTGAYVGVFGYSSEMSFFPYEDGYITSKQFESRVLLVDHSIYVET